MHNQRKKLTMDVEIQVAVQFIVSFLSSKFTDKELDEFIKNLNQGLCEKFEGHWYPEKPTKGSAYRCISIENHLDGVLTKASKKACLDLALFTNNLPKKLDLWIDPAEVSYRIGEHGSVIVIYKEGDDCVNSTSEYLAKVLEKLPTVVQQKPLLNNQTKNFNNRNSPLISTPQQIANNFNLANAQRHLENCLSPTAKTFVSRKNSLPNVPYLGNRSFNHAAALNPLLNLEYLQKLQWPLLLASGYDPIAAQLVQNYLIMQELQRFETRRLALQSHYLKLQSIQFAKKQHHMNNRSPQHQQHSTQSTQNNRLQLTA